MLKKTITYTDFNDNELTEDFYFRLSKPELTELETEVEGGLLAKIKKIVANNDYAEGMRMFHSLIIKSYGIKSEDGKSFVKSDEIALAFTQSAAYEVLYSEILADENSAVNFILGILPKDVAEKAKEEMNKKNA